MTKTLARFIEDVCNESGIKPLELDENYNIWYTYSEKKFVISWQEINKYYQGYLLSNQKRYDAVTRASNRVKKLINNFKAKCDRQNKRNQIKRKD